MNELIKELLTLVRCKNQIINNCKFLSLKETFEYTDYLNSEILKKKQYIWKYAIATN